MYNYILERGTVDLGMFTTLISSRGSRPILIFLLGAPSNPNTSIEQPIRQVQQGRPARLRRILAMPSKWKKQGDYFSLSLLSPWAYGPLQPASHQADCLEGFLSGPHRQGTSHQSPPTTTVHAPMVVQCEVDPQQMVSGSGDH